MPAVMLQHRHVFGLKSSVKGTVHFTDEAQIIYPAGHNSIQYQMDQRVQARVFPGTEGSEGITCMAVSPNRKSLAVCERFSDVNHSKAICSMFDLSTGKRRRGTLSYSLCDAKEFVCCAFSADSKYLITQGGAPDWTLSLWSWDKARHHAATKVSSHANSVIHECSFSPLDHALICVIGDGVFKLFRLQENQFRNIPNQLGKLREASNQNYVCHAWLNDDKLVVCSEAGDALLFDGSGEFKMTLLCSPGEMRSMLCVVPSPKGFIAGGEDGIVRWFDRVEGDVKEYFRKTKEARLDNGLKNSGPGVGAVTALAVNPSEETLAIATEYSQLLQLSLNPSDLLKPEDALSVENIVSSFHTGSIVGLDVCVRKPLVVTCGSDRSVRIWNYYDRTQELCKFFHEDVFSVAFHPSGFSLIAGFSDKLRLMNLLMEDMRMYKEVPIKACRECRFSHGGQFFAAVNSNTVQVYKTYTCEVVCSLRGHQSKVRSVCWTADDSRLITTGSDGAIFEFDVLQDGRPISQWSQKGSSSSCVVAYTDLATQTNTMYVVGTDKVLKEVQNAALNYYVESNAIIGQLALANSTRALFAGVAEPELPGAVRCYAYPLDGDYVEYQAHAAPVSRVRITFDENFVFSVGEDGCLVIFDVIRRNPPRQRDGFSGFADEILVTKTFLDNKQTQITELDKQVEDLTKKIDLELRQRDSYHREMMAGMEEKYSDEIDIERRRYESMREEKRDLETGYEKNYKLMEDMHSKQMSDLEKSFQSKMDVEVKRFEKLAKDKEREQTEWEASHSQLLQEHEAVIEKMKNEHERQQQQNWSTRDRIVKEKESALKTHHETLKQLEQDADREIEELKEMYEQKLGLEKEEKVRLRGQAGMHRKYHEECHRENRQKMDEVRKEEENNRKADNTIAGLIKEKDSNEKEIKERDKTIADKEQRIYDLKKQNQELEKFKFVLDYKIRELKAQIDPKNDDINSMRTQIHAMDAELDEYVRKNKQLALDISQLQMKQRALQEEIKSQKRRLRDDMALIKRFKLALSDCMETINEPKALKDNVANLYRKYVQSTSSKLDLDTDQQDVYNRQREYLEKSVESLKSKLEKDSQAHRIDNMRRMQENVSLIREINDLRREINALKNERTAQELRSSNKDSFVPPWIQAKKEQEEEISNLTQRLRQLQRSTPHRTPRVEAAAAVAAAAPSQATPDATTAPSVAPAADAERVEDAAGGDDVQWPGGYAGLAADVGEDFDPDTDETAEEDAGDATRFEDVGDATRLDVGDATQLDVGDADELDVGEADELYIEDAAEFDVGDTGELDIGGSAELDGGGVVEPDDSEAGASPTSNAARP